MSDDESSHGGVGSVLSPRRATGDVDAKVGRAGGATADDEALQDDLFRRAPAMIHSIDAKGRLLSVSDHWLARLGYERHEVIGRPSTDFLTEESRRLALSTLPEFFARGRCDELHYRIRCKSGNIIDVLLSAVLERDGSGAPLRSVAVLTDVTERLCAERALDDERSRLAAILDATGAGSWEWHVASGELRQNERWADIAGLRPQDVPASRTLAEWVENVHPDDRERVAERLREHLEGVSSRYECEMRIRHRAGHWVWVHDQGCVQSYGRDGTPKWMFGTRLDITRRRQREESLRRGVQLLDRTGEIAGVGGWELELPEGTLHWSTQTRRIHEVDDDYQPSLQEAIDFYAPEARPAIRAAIERAMTDGSGWDLQAPLVSREGRARWVRAVGVAERDAQGRTTRVYGAFQDIADLRRLDETLADRNELLHVTLKSIGDAVITTDTAGRVTWMNPVAERLTGWSNAEASGHRLGEVFHIVHEQTRRRSEDPALISLREEAVVALAPHTLLLRRDGAEFAVEDSAAPIRDGDGRVLGVVIVFHDVSEQRRLSHEMQHRATHDALTGLVNRAEFEARLARLLDRTRGDGSEHALMFIDLDRFKTINDTCGHAVGDRLLRQLASLFEGAMRTGDTLARLGGDEFGVLLEHCSSVQAGRVAEQILERIEAFRFFEGGRRFDVGISIGLVPFDARWSDVPTVIEAADSACYAAKGVGGQRVHHWRESSLPSFARLETRNWSGRLERALVEDRFALHAQRLYVLRGPARGMRAEVLLRLVEPDGSLVLPDVFMSSAERFGIAPRLDAWVVRRTVEMLGCADLASVESIGVNLTARSIGDRAFHHEILGMLDRVSTGVKRRLCLEVAESAVLVDTDNAARFIERLRALGVRVALDDFGAGSSDFGYLRAMPVDALKIHSRSISATDDPALEDAALRCFAAVATAIGAVSIAKGVENPSVLERLVALRVDQVQGRSLHLPEPLEQVLRAAADARPESWDIALVTADEGGSEAS